MAGLAASRASWPRERAHLSSRPRNCHGLWKIRSFFKLDVKEKLTAWTVQETVVSVTGLRRTLVLAAVLR
jgi:GntP family permease